MIKNNIHQSFILGLLITTVLLASQAPVESNRAEREAKVNWLLAVANLQWTSIPITDEIRKQYFEEGTLLYQKEEDMIEQARNELAAMGEEIIDQLIEIYKDGRYQNHIALVLKKIGTQKAKETLLNMAVGQNAFNWTYSNAARQYVELVENKEELKPLLDSKDAVVLSIALQSIKGVEVDAELLKRLEDLLQSVEYHPVLNYSLRIKAAEVIAADSGNELIQKKVSAIIKSLQTVEQLPSANERFQYDRVGTFADITYLELARALVQMRGAEIYLSEATNSLTGNPRRWILAVRANRGDSSVKSEIKDILEDPNMLERTTLRSWAIRGFNEIGTTEDIPFLRNIAETDPVVVFDRGGPLLETINGKPINNTGERAVMYDEDEYVKSLWDKVQSSGRKSYIIRSQAELIMQAIEAKEKEKTADQNTLNN